MTSLNDPLTLPNGLVLPNRLMKAALSEALGIGDTLPITGCPSCTGDGAPAGTALS
jgi:hypothetical protein